MSPVALPERPRPDDPFVADLLGRCTFPDAVEVTCSVSGGADSVALLALAVAAGHRVAVVHVDHGLRATAAQEAAAVTALCQHWRVPCRVERVRVGDGADLEQRARRARHAALPFGALLGHTLDDQAETLLIRLLRGTGPSGLAEMDPRTHPILGLRRAETRALCVHLGVPVVEDPSNADPRFVRNRVRSEVLPLLDDVAGRDVAPLLARLAHLAARQRDWLEESAGGVDATDAAALGDAPQPLAAAAFVRWWHAETGREHPPGQDAIERALSVARGDAVGADIVGGWSVRRSAGRLRLERTGSSERPSVGPGSGGGGARGRVHADD